MQVSARAIHTEVEQMPELLVNVAANIGIGIVPECAKFSWGRFISFIPISEEAYVDIWLITHADASPAVKNFRTRASEWIKAQGREPMQL